MHKHLILGGTFDHLHLGHKKLIEKCFYLGEKVTIGITKENLYQNKFLSETIEDYKIRKSCVIKFLAKKGWLTRSKLVPIGDFAGSSVIDKNIDAIVVSKTTYKNALKINEIRREKNFRPLKIIVVENILDEDGKLLTSERIRAGEIDREGKVYAKIFTKTLKLPENLREKLRRPLGKIIVGRENELEKTARKLLHYINIMEWKPVMFLAVGDIIAMSLERVGFYPQVKIIDLKSRRKMLEAGPVSSRLATRLINNPGTISGEAVAVLQKAIKQCLGYPQDKRFRQTIIIAGEEDLITLPAILLAPLNSVVLYGQMDLGAVIVQVNEETKKNAQQILAEFR